MKRIGCTIPRRGHTLMEVLISTVIVSIVMAAMLGVMLLGSRAIDNEAGGATARQTGDVMDQVAMDLSLAQGLTERQSGAVTMTVPDRDGDGQAETIRYAWSGAAGDPLTRQYNGGDPVVLAENVHHFDLSYLLATVAAGQSPPGEEPEESDEMVLIQHDDAPGGQFRTRNVEYNKWCAQYFKPTLPGNAVSWKITQVRFRARRSWIANGVISVQIRTADGSLKPTANVLAQTQVNEWTLGEDYSWETISIGPVADLDPDQGYCLVIRYVSGIGDAAEIQYEKDGSPMTSNTHWMTTNNGEGHWSNPNDSRDMRFLVYGTVTTEGS